MCNLWEEMPIPWTSNMPHACPLRSNDFLRKRLFAQFFVKKIVLLNVHTATKNFQTVATRGGMKKLILVLSARIQLFYCWHWSPEVNTFRCIICDKGLSSKEKLNRHNRTSVHKKRQEDLGIFTALEGWSFFLQWLLKVLVRRIFF